MRGRRLIKGAALQLIAASLCARLHQGRNAAQGERTFLQRLRVLRSNFRYRPQFLLVYSDASVARRCGVCLTPLLEPS